jgi:gamma-glutamyl:cysteine ligase YbdK (ATP-grasp superfamily)
MGKEVERDAFEEQDYVRFRERLEECLAELGQLLARPGFGVGPASVGAELELFLIDSAGKPLPRNQAVLAAAADQRLTVELDRFNVEINSSPAPLAGRPFSGLGAELTQLLDRISTAAGTLGGRAALIGILPTLSLADLGPGAITDVPRYRALDRGLLRLRQHPFVIQISGDEPVELTVGHIDVEGANTSFQVHLRVDPADFTRTYNAAQLAVAPALAVAGNSPTFLGHRLWHETRIALFKQAVEDREAATPRRRPARTALGTGWVRGGALELFTESVRQYPPVLPQLTTPQPLPAGADTVAPPLPELRLHQGTIWRWNRAIYDPAYGGHLRIEMRALPAGPTVIDMMANAAFQLGLTLSLASEESWTHAMPFERAVHSFHCAARDGLAAELTWPTRGPGLTRTVTAATLLRELIPQARAGLVEAGVVASEADALLEVIDMRAATGQTGAAWQRAVLADAERRLDRERALAFMLDRYLECAADGQPVHTWPATP